MTPPNGESSPIGRNAAAATRPVQPGRPVRAVTKTPTATVCIHEPTLDNRAAHQIRAKLRCWSGRRALNMAVGKPTRTGRAESGVPGLGAPGRTPIGQTGRLRGRTRSFWRFVLGDGPFGLSGPSYQPELDVAVGQGVEDA